MRLLISLLAMLALCAIGPVRAQAPAKIGVVTMHGKGGSPNRFIHDLASTLERNDILVANLEMPWSGKRHYDADVAAAEKQVQEALDALRTKGATRLFVAGHSYGGTFAFYLGGRLPVDGVIAIAPGGASEARVVRIQLGDSLAQARKFVAEGKGSQRVELSDYEGSRGTYPITTVPAAYVTWFDPEGAMNQGKSLKALKPDMPVLYVSPSDDYPGLLKGRSTISGSLPRNAHTRRYEPSSDHLNAPRNSADEIVKWVRLVAG
jgi:pimeloyl-ACP methyl ester carboxylesterase